MTALLDNDHLQAHARRFRHVAAKALADDDTAEAWNAALEYAREFTLTSLQMTRVLALLRERREVRPEVLRDWAAQGADALGERALPGVADQLVNQELRTHVASVEWAQADKVQLLHAWFDRFNDQMFARALPRAAISVARDRVTTLGSYRPQRDGLGLRFRINLNAVYLDQDLDVVLETLLHEMVHQWEEVTGVRVTSSYHTRAFRVKARELGIPTDERGRSLGAPPDGPFAQLLAAHGVVLSPATLTGSVGVARRKGSSKLRKWTCGCQAIRVSAREFHGRCEREGCGKPFVCV